MNNKTRIIIGVVIAVLFVIGIVALEQTQPINSSEPTKITNKNNTQIQNNSTDTIEMESLTIVKYASNKDKSSKVNTKPKSTITDKSSKVNTNSKNKSVDVAENCLLLVKRYLPFTSPDPNEQIGEKESKLKWDHNMSYADNI